MIDLPEATVRKAQQGDQTACRTIVEALHRPIIATLFRFLGPRWRGEIEDLAQEVFLKLFRALDRFDPARAKFTTWMYTFVRNHCFDVLKKRHLPTTSLNAGEQDSQRELPDDRELRPQQHAENSELGQRIGEALGQLGEDQRMVFILREYEGLDYGAIAEVVGVSEGTVKSRLFRAKEALRERLEPWLRAGA
ncbi:MAG: sigma-70 family RNA polymerase sigma factor [Planctomycetes bacterium]|nr:sigma-70 family RNA polymerase sigma factor [Planctomycetota bacterium]